MAPDFDFAQMWQQVETAREKKGLNEEDAAKACGFSRATWFNYHKDPSKPRLREMVKIAKLLGFSFRSPIAKARVSDPGSTLPPVASTGGLTLKEHVARVALWMQGLNEAQQKEVAERVEEYLKLRGFLSPGADGAADARLKHK